MPASELRILSADVPSLDDVIAAAGLDAALADALRSEEITVEVLLSSSLAERREILRAMNQTFGTVLSINRVLEEFKKEVGAAPDGDDREDEASDDDADSNGLSDVSSQQDNDDAGGMSQEEPLGFPHSPQTPNATDDEEEHDEEQPATTDHAPIPLREPLNPKLASILQAAALLLGSAESHTLRSLQTYLGNVLSHPDKLSYRTIQLANPLFHERVWGVPGGASLLRAAGFAEATLAGNTAVLRLPCVRLPHNSSPAPRSHRQRCLPLG